MIQHTTITFDKSSLSCKDNISLFIPLDEFFFSPDNFKIVFYIKIKNIFKKIDFQIMSLCRANFLFLHLYLWVICENHGNMNNKVNEFYPSFVFFLNMVLL